MESVATIGHETVLSLLPMSECIDLIASALEALERGSADMPLRTWRSGLERRVHALLRRAAATRRVYQAPAALAATP